MTVVRSRARARARNRATAAALVAVTAWTTAACDDAGTAPASKPVRTWQEPASYVYTLDVREQVLWGRFRVTVRDGKVAEASGLDADSRRALQESPARPVPTIGELLDRLDRARADDADTAKADYTADGLPRRITLDWDENAIDDEAEYVISGFRAEDPPSPRPTPP
ncbi:DUF6174 domain-containing protein [Streptomyces sp. NPDC018693]|uniref:DUF6174 domain-containing protein n=1 Tax=unclassified Streptomyces TaxID=2593676 RepID=UPI0037A56447